MLQLLSLPTTIGSITIEFQVVLLEKNECYESKIEFDQKTLRLNFRDFMPREDIINCKQLTFKIFTKILEVRDIMDEEIPPTRDNFKHEIESLNLSYLPSATLIWTTKDRELVEAMKKYVWEIIKQQIFST